MVYKDNLLELDSSQMGFLEEEAKESNNALKQHEDNLHHRVLANFSQVMDMVKSSLLRVVLARLYQVIKIYSNLGHHLEIHRNRPNKDQFQLHSSNHVLHSQKINEEDPKDNKDHKWFKLRKMVNLLIMLLKYVRLDLDDNRTHLDLHNHIVHLHLDNLIKGFNNQLNNQQYQDLNQQCPLFHLSLNLALVKP